MDTTNPKIDKASGAIDRTVGKTKEVIGEAFNNSKPKTKGAVKETLQEGFQKAGDFLERAGKKLGEKGFIKVGSVVEKAGDKLEHLMDGKKKPADLH